MIEAHQATRAFAVGGETVYAVREVSVTLEQGRFFVIRGKSGSGKTTLLNLLGGLERPTTGTISYLGRDLASYSQREMTRWRRTVVGFVFQAFALLPELSARENVSVPLRISGGGVPSQGSYEEQSPSKRQIVVRDNKH